MTIHPRPPAPKVKRLLAACQLPTSDLDPARLEHFFGCGPQAEPKGVVGVELHGEFGLLRSLAVDQTARKRGCGSRLLEAAEQHAAANGVRALYLLTSTAQAFFRAHGYAQVERDAVPEAIRGTSEFARLCPASAIVMTKRIGG